MINWSTQLLFTTRQPNWCVPSEVDKTARVTDFGLGEKDGQDLPTKTSWLRKEEKALTVVTPESNARALGSGVGVCFFPVNFREKFCEEITQI